MKNTELRRIIIVGGGSAGWLAAGILAAEHGRSGNAEALKITLIESPAISPIGVGEGTWPTMRNTLKRIGISEADFLCQTSASFKQGSKFVGWRNGEDVYYHPFSLPDGYAETNLYNAWKAFGSGASFADTVNIQSQLCMTGRAPKQLQTPEYAAVTNYAYHLDSEKFCGLLKHHCQKNLGVHYLEGHVSKIIPDESGYIEGVEVKGVGVLEADLFIDCSGTKSLLLGGHFNIPFCDKSAILFNDSAIAVQMPYEHENAEIASTTVATAQDDGWIWDIGLYQRRGVGYVYSSSFTSDDAVHIKLNKYLNIGRNKNISNALTFKKLSFNSGYREKCWYKNCVAIGLSAGFLEPLEASGLAMIELSALALADELPKNRDHMKLVARRFNTRCQQRWDHVIEFLKLHYVLSQRRDSDYWRHNQESETIPEPLQYLLELWRYQSPTRDDLAQFADLFPSASFQYVLYGMGFKTEARTSNCSPMDLKIAKSYFSRNREKVSRYQSILPTNRDLLRKIHTH